MALDWSAGVQSCEEVSLSSYEVGSSIWYLGTGRLNYDSERCLGVL